MAAGGRGSKPGKQPRAPRPGAKKGGSKPPISPRQGKPPAPATPAESDFLKALEKRALAGDPKGYPRPETRRDALALLRWFCDTVDADEPVPPEIMSYLRKAFGRVIGRERCTADEALGLLKPKHREEGQFDDRNKEIVERIFDLRQSNVTLPISIQTAAQEFHLEVRTIERIWEDAIHHLSEVEKKRLFGE